MSEAAIYIFILSQCLHIATSDCSNKLKNTNYFSKVTTNNQPSCINQSLLKSCARKTNMSSNAKSIGIICYHLTWVSVSLCTQPIDALALQDHNIVCLFATTILQCKVINIHYICWLVWRGCSPHKWSIKSVQRALF